MADQFDLMVLPASAMKGKRLSNKRGHASVPGTGPEGETCRSCANLVRLYMAKTYLKCGLMRPFWTGGQATDVRAGDAACKRWEAKRDD